MLVLNNIITILCNMHFINTFSKYFQKPECVVLKKLLVTSMLHAPILVLESIYVLVKKDILEMEKPVQV